MPWSPSDADEHKDGLSESEKEQWAEVANNTLQQCLDDGGDQQECEASAIRQANGVVGNQAQNCNAPALHRHNLGANYETRVERFMGRRHLVAPVVLMVEGVHNGSQGPTLYTREELAKFPEAWNGRPLPVMHPEDEVGPISCNSPEVIEQQSVGWLFGVHYGTGPNGDRPGLYGEIWVDEDRAEQVSPDTLNTIRSGEGLEVSTGVFNDPERTGGEWSGEQYWAIARNLRPDHLALLPGERGACSWEDGCGVRANQEGEMGHRRRTNRTGELDNHKEGCGCEACQAAANQSEEEAGNQPDKQHPLQANQVGEGYRETLMAVQQKLDSMDHDGVLHFLEEMYDDEVVYRAEGRSDISLYKQGYQVNEDGSVELTGEAQQVRRQVNYEPVGETPANNSERQEDTMGKVDQLISNQNTQFTEDDREWLGNLSEAQVDKLFPAAPEANSQGQGISKEEALEALRDSFQDKDSFLNLLPADLREQFSHGLSLHQQRRDELINRITGNSDVYTQEELQGKDIQELEKIGALVKPQVNHAPMGGGQAPTDNSNAEAPAPLLPTGVQPSSE